MQKQLHSIRFIEENCIGCIRCLKACPTKAIRVFNGKAQMLEERCIDCGECFRVCQNNAIVSATTSRADLKQFECTIAIPSPVLYSQFSSDIMPNQILLALKKIGFDYVFDEAWDCELTSSALKEYLNHAKPPFPKISITCPVVVRLIASRYPSLIDNFVPIQIPRESAAKKFRDKASKSRATAPEKIGVIHITPCPAKMVSINSPLGQEKSYLDGAIAIREIYGPLLKTLKDIEEEVILQLSSGVGIAWAMSGGEIMSLWEENCLAVSGVDDVIQVLNQVESGQWKDILFLECMICPDGCVGGSLTVQNRHVAKRRIQFLIQMFGEKSRVSKEMLLRLYREKYFDMAKRIEAAPSHPLDSNRKKAIAKMKQRNEIIKKLSGKNCSVCGSPDCETFAEDVVLERAKLTDCVFLTRECHEVK